jgi:hypothetical protein
MAREPDSLGFRFALGASIKLRRNCLGQRGYLCDLHKIILSGNPTGPCRLPLQGLACRAVIEADDTCAAIAPTQLGSARLSLARTISCRLDQQVSRLKQQFETDDGFHRTPLVYGRLKAPQHVLPRAIRAGQCQLPNELNSFGCAAQYNWWTRADTQLWIDWKVSHGQLTPGCERGSLRPSNESARGNSFPTAQSAWKGPIE